MVAEIDQRIAKRHRAQRPGGGTGVGLAIGPGTAIGTRMGRGVGTRLATWDANLENIKLRNQMLGQRLNGGKVVTNLEQYMGTNTRVLSPSVVTETRFGYTRFYNSVGTLLAFQRNVVDELGIPGLKGGDPVSWGIPSISIANYNGIGDGTDGPFENKNNTLQFINNTSITRGSHSFRFGGEIRRDQFNQVGNQYGRGSFSFSQVQTQDPSTHSQGDGFASFLLGNVSLTEVAAQIASVQFRATSFAVYVDDVWKVTPKLTLSLGLRYENTPRGRTRRAI